MPSSISPSAGVCPMSAPLAKMSLSGVASRMVAMSALAIST